MTSLMLFNEQPLQNRVFKVYGAMKQSAAPKLWKKDHKRGYHRKGQVRVPGLTALPFTKEDLWRLALQQIGTGAIRCPYCVEIGKPANTIDLVNCVFDHKFPKARAGQELSLSEVWSLDNLVCVCADCNNLKGKLSYPFFIGIMAAIERYCIDNSDFRDRDAIYACLRTHGTVVQGWVKGNKKAAEEADGFAPMPIPTNRKLALRADDDF